MSFGNEYTVKHQGESFPTVPNHPTEPSHPERRLSLFGHQMALYCCCRIDLNLPLRTKCQTLDYHGHELRSLSLVRAREGQPDERRGPRRRTNSHQQSKESLVSAVSGVDTNVCIQVLRDVWREERSLDPLHPHIIRSGDRTSNNKAKSPSITKIGLRGRQRIHEDDDTIVPFHILTLRSVCTYNRFFSAHARIIYLSIRMSSTRETSTPPPGNRQWQGTHHTPTLLLRRINCQTR